IYISELNLNQEEGIVEEPYTPALRYATPLFNADGDLGAILVFNLLPDEVFNIASQRNPNAVYYVSNAVGDIMYSNAEDAESILYASDLGHDTSIHARFPKLPAQTDQANFIIDEIKNCLISYIPILVDDGIQERRWLLVREQNLASIVMPINQTVLSIFVMGILGLLVSAGVSVAITRTLIRPLKSLLSASKDLRERNWQSSIELTRAAKSRDEIGEHAQSFE